nr:GNAT family N-acetyltransferase [Neisseria bacilliformis]
MQNTKTPNTPSENHSASPKPRYRLTKLGEQMARLPIDPKVARILLAAQKHDCMAEILVIVSALSIQDPRERPLEAREAAAKAHERFADKQSDFLAYLNIWDSFQRERDKGLSNRQMVAWCHQYFLSHLRMREWRELHAQLAQIAVEMGLTDKENAFRRPQAPAPQPVGRILESDKNRAAAKMSDTSIRPTHADADLSARLKQKELDKKHARAERRAAKEASYEQIHRALLTGLIANVGMKSPDGNDYTGARGSRFHLFPASALFKAKPKWVMAAELVETTKLYARDVAAIQPEWIEQEAPHLVKYHYFEPHWEQKRGEVVASERVTLYGLTVLPRRPVAYGRIAPEEAREIFIRSALVAQEVADFNAPFFVHNQKLIREIVELEHKSRRQDVLVDEEALFAFYDERLPKAVFKERGEIVGQAENGQRSSETPFRAERLAPKGFAARQMTAADLDALYGLCQSQPDYYRHLGEPLTREKLARSLTALPPQACRENKHFIGFWQQGSLKAALEIIFAYPDEKTLLIGLLMVDKSAQGAGIGSNIVQNLAAFSAKTGCREIILSYAEGNAQSRAFWLKNGFAETGEIDEAEEQGGANLITMSRCLPSERQPENRKTPPETANPATRAVPSPARGGGLGWGQTSDAPANSVSAETAPPPQPSPAQAQEREQSAAASTLSDNLRPANPQQTAPSPVGEGWGEGKTVVEQTNFSAAAATPLPNPLPQEREQGATTSTLSDDPKVQRLPENSLCYADGQPILLGDRVTIDSKQWHGKIVALIAEQQCDPSIGSAEEWATLQSGVMAQFDEAGLVHYPDAETAGELILLARADAADVLKSKKHNIGCVAPAAHADSKDTDNRVREPLPEYCRPKIRIADATEQRDRLCRLLVAQNQYDLATWAMQCVQHILPLLPDAVEADAVHDAFDLLKRWQNGQADVAQLRQTGFALHKLAKEQQNPVATAVLRAAGQAVGVGHMKEHAPVCGDYAVKAVGLANGQNPQAVSQERQWQLEQLQQIAAQPSSLHPERLPENTAGTLSDDPKPKKQPAPQKGRLKPLPLADIRTFQAWLKTAERNNPRLLFLSRDDLMQHAAAHITEEQFPKHWQTADGKFKLSYRFEPHHPLDGVTLTLPLTVLNRISPAALEWLVPGMIREKIQLQIKALPKQIRRICVPVPEFVTRFLESSPDRSQSIIPQLARFIAKTAGDIRILDQINLDDWTSFRLPEHCYFNLRIIDDGGQELAMGRDLIQIQQQLGKAAATTFRDNTQEFERDNVTTWDIGTLPESIKFARGKQQLTGYLGLQKEKDGRIALRLFDTSAAAEQAHRLGVIELMKLQLKEQVKDLNKGIQGFTQAAMLLKHINADTLRDDLTQAVCDRAFIGEDELPRNEKAFKEQIKRARSRLPAVKEALSRYLQETAAAYAELNGKLGKHPLTQLLRQRLQTLLAAGFATRTPWAQWPRLPIYLKAMTLRLEKYSSNPARDAAREADIQELEQMWQEKTDGLVKQGQPVSDDLAAFRWMIEELRVSLFAQELKTPYPVSVKRLMKEWDKLDK